MGPFADTPSGVVTTTSPASTPSGTSAVIAASPLILNLASTPPNDTAVAPKNPYPESEMLAPTGPSMGMSVDTTGLPIRNSLRCFQLIARRTTDHTTGDADMKLPVAYA